MFERLWSLQTSADLLITIKDGVGAEWLQKICAKHQSKIIFLTLGVQSMDNLVHSREGMSYELFILLLRIIQLLQMSKQINSSLLQGQNIEAEKTPSPAAPVDLMDFEYKEFSNEPRINFSKLTLVVLAPVMVLAHIGISRYFGIPMIQYSFVTTLTAFIINYTWIIRKHELMPYLPIESFDNRLKLLCVISLTGLLLSIHYGWNGSGGILFAMYWEITRGQKIGIYGLFFGAIIVGSLLMENNYTFSKLWQFLPGLLFGYVNSQIFKLKDSNPYSMAHQFIFLCSIGLPIFFPAAKLIVPSLMQWVLMIVCGAVILFTVIIIIKLMQMTRVSVVMGVFSGLLVAGTTAYSSGIDYLGLVLIAGGAGMLIKKEFYDVQF